MTVLVTFFGVILILSGLIFWVVSGGTLLHNANVFFNPITIFAILLGLFEFYLAFKIIPNKKLWSEIVAIFLFFAFFAVIAFLFLS